MSPNRPLFINDINKIVLGGDRLINNFNDVFKLSSPIRGGDGDSKAPREPREPRENREPREPRIPRDSKKPHVPRENRENKTLKTEEDIKTLVLDKSLSSLLDTNNKLDDDKVIGIVEEVKKLFQVEKKLPKYINAVSYRLVKYQIWELYRERNPNNVNIMESLKMVAMTKDNYAYWNHFSKCVLSSKMLNFPIVYHYSNYIMYYEDYAGKRINAESLKLIDPISYKIIEFQKLLILWTLYKADLSANDYLFDIIPCETTPIIFKINKLQFVIPINMIVVLSPKTALIGAASLEQDYLSSIGCLEGKDFISVFFKNYINYLNISTLINTNILSVYNEKATNIKKGDLLVLRMDRNSFLVVVTEVLGNRCNLLLVQTDTRKEDVAVFEVANVLSSNLYTIDDFDIKSVSLNKIVIG